MFRFPYGNGLLRNVVENAAIPTFLVGMDGKVFFANRAFGDLLGYTTDEIVSLGIAKIVHPDEAATARAQVTVLAEGKAKSYRAERRYINRSGEVVWVLVSGALLADEETGKPLYISVQAVDIDRQKRAEAALAESEERWNFALEGAGQGVWDQDLIRGKVFFSHMWRQMRGIDLGDEVDASEAAWLARVHPEDRENVLAQLARHRSGEKRSGERPVQSLEYRERNRDGHWMWILSRGRPMAWNPDGSVARIIGTDTDITDLKAEEARAAEEAAETYRRHLTALETAQQATEAAHRLAELLARHDVLTGLPNRRVFAEALDAAHARADRSASSYTILIIDLDRFKPINDIHGHHVGDDVLREIAIRLGSVIRKGDTLARLGGDEFGIILDCAGLSETPQSAAVALAERIIACAQAPIGLAGRSVEVGASVGIAVFPTDGRDSDTLMRAADMAMYRAKESGRSRYCFFEEGMEVALKDRVELEDDVRQAVARQDIKPHYQPLIKLSENRLAGFEILARWHHATKGNIEPDVFIPVVEKLGLIGEFTYSLLRRACLDARNWPSDITIALNVSPLHFTDPLLPVKFLAILSETGFSPKRLEIEVTESSLVDDLPAARTILIALQDVGIKISLDDFGTGYSSLYNLRELRFDKIKIDRSFVLSMGTNEESAKIVHSVLDLAKSLGLPTIAEGIEHAQAVKQIMASGGVYGQGFYFGKAMPAEEADRLVRGEALKADRPASA